jgi:hypothetical protein
MTLREKIKKAISKHVNFVNLNIQNSFIDALMEAIESESGWIKVDYNNPATLPSKKILGAGEYGVTVIGFDWQEYLDSGDGDRGVVNFDFEKNYFLEPCTGEDGFIPAPWITHWMPFPKPPKEGK